MKEVRYCTACKSTIVKMHKYISWALILIMLLSACQVREIELPVNSVTVSELKDHIFYLASDDLQGRRNGTKNYYVAAGYAASQFRQSGLIPVCADTVGDKTYFQRIPDSGDELMFNTICSMLKREGDAGYDKITEIIQSTDIENYPLGKLNVVALVRGTDPKIADEFITAGAHLDHLGIRRDSIYNGADDNASGCSVILEVAEAVALSGPKRSVLFILYDSEETGLVGSKYFVNNSPVPLDQILVNINLDMVGRPDGISDELGVIGAGQISPGLNELIYDVNNNATAIPLDSIDHRNYFRRSDQYSYFTVGIPSVLLTTGEHNEYHTPRDDADKIDYKFLEQVGILTYEVIMALANEENRNE